MSDSCNENYTETKFSRTQGRVGLLGWSYTALPMTAERMGNVCSRVKSNRLRGEREANQHQ